MTNEELALYKELREKYQARRQECDETLKSLDTYIEQMNETISFMHKKYTPSNDERALLNEVIDIITETKISLQMLYNRYK